jgi:hypothetical protein
MPVFPLACPHYTLEVVNFMKRYSFLLQLILVFLLWILAVLARIKFHGLVYGLDFGLYHPDGSLYSVQALTFTGLGEETAYKIVNDFYFLHASKINNLDASVLFNNPNWVEYKYRFMYPLLSVPFVTLLGMPGMLVIPGISFLILLMLPVLLCHHKSLGITGLFISAAILSSPTIVRWMFANISDSLLVAVISLFVLLETRNFSFHKWIVLIVPLIFVSSTTRFCLPLWLGIALVYFMDKEKRRALVITVLSVICALPTFLLSMGIGILPTEGNASLVSKLLSYPRISGKVIFYEVGQLFVMDKLLLFALILAVFITFRNRARISSRFFLISLASLAFTGSINGVIGVNFRYQMPLIVFMIWVFVDWFRARLPESLHKPR